MFLSEGVNRLSSIMNTLCVCVSEWCVRRVTRSLKTTVQQQQFIDVHKALQILDQETPPLVVDKVKLKVCGILWVLVYIVTGQIGFSASGQNSQKP